MSEAISSAVSLLPLAERQELQAAVAQLFSVFQRKYGNARWGDRFNDEHARPTWLASFAAAGLSAADVKLGLASLSKRGTGWPPSDEEFITLCRPPSPSISEAIADAQRWARDPSVEFSHAAIGAAAKSVGSWNLRSLDERALNQAFGAAYRTALDRHARGESLDVPIPRALPAKVRTGIPRGQVDPPAVAEARAKAARLLGLASS